MKENIEQKGDENQNNMVKHKEVKSTMQQKSSVGNNKKPLTPYQKYKLSKNKNGKKYFDFYNDVKVYTHDIYDW